ncbi:MAG: TetR/AcrR family transcriptional regulator [Mariprofundaceae bacterium]
MTKAGEKRARLVNAAKMMIHRQGFNKTTLVHIARQSGVPLGNVYYYFKTKDEIASAAIQERRQSIKSAAEKWEQNPDPRKRLLSFLGMVEDMRQTISKYGCPVGSLCQELDKNRTDLTNNADETLHWMINWASGQFLLMGKENAAELGLQLVTILQGASLIAHALQDPDIISRQIHQTRTWLQTL